MDGSMKGGLSVVSREECDTTRGGRYSLGKLSLGRKKFWQSMFVVLFEKSYMKSGGINSNTYARLNPCSPNWRHFNPCDEQ